MAKYITKKVSRNVGISIGFSELMNTVDGYQVGDGVAAMYYESENHNYTIKINGKVVDAAKVVVEIIEKEASNNG